MADERIWDAYTNGSFRPRLVGEIVETRPPLVLHPARLPDPTIIPPRQWLYGTQLVRGYVTVLVAPGGTGKSAYAMGVVLALVSGKPFLGERIFLRVNGAVMNLEDPMEELERRLAALMLRHNIQRADIEGRFFLDDGAGRGFAIASLGDDGYSVIHPDERALIEQITQNNIGVVVCDPFAESHSLEENNNPQMVQAATAWRRVARATDSAILLVHHVRKGDATGIDAARGAKALTDSARVGLLMTTMAASEGEDFGINADDRWQYVRLDDAKRNMAPAAKAKWFKLDQVALHNCTEAYPNGDKVAAIVHWEPTNVWNATTPADINAALDAIRDGPAPGILYSASRRGRNAHRWVGQVLCHRFEITEEQALPMVETWLRSGLLWEDDYTHPEYRRKVAGVRVNDNLRPSG